MVEDNVRQIYAYLDNEMTAEQMRLFEERLRLDSKLCERFEEFQRARTLWSEARVAEEALDAVDWAQMDSKMYAAISEAETSTNIWHPARLFLWAAAAASIVLAVYIWFDGAKGPSPSERLVASGTIDDAPVKPEVRLSHGERHRSAAAVTVRFSDARIQLEAGAEIRAIEKTAGVAQVEMLQGGAVFSVSPRSPGERFEVLAGAVTVTVVGTEFQVVRTMDRVTVSVSHGTVMASTLESEPVTLTSGMSNTFNSRVTRPSEDVGEPAVHAKLTVKKAPPAVAEVEATEEISASKQPKRSKKLRRHPRKASPSARSKPQVSLRSKKVRPSGLRERERPTSESEFNDSEPDHGASKVPGVGAAPIENAGAPSGSPAERMRPAKVRKTMTVLCQDVACQELKGIFRGIDSNGYSRSISLLRGWIDQYPEHRHRTAARYAIGYCEFGRGNRTVANRIFSERAMSRWITSVKAFENPPKPR